MSGIHLLPELIRMEVEFGFREEVYTEDGEEIKSEKLIIRIGNDQGDLQFREVTSITADPGLVVVKLNQISPTPSRSPLIIDTGRTAQLNNSYELKIDTILYENDQEVEKRKRRNTQVKVTSGGGAPASSTDG